MNESNNGRLDNEYGEEIAVDCVLHNYQLRKRGASNNFYDYLVLESENAKLGQRDIEREAIYYSLDESCSADSLYMLMLMVQLLKIALERNIEISDIRAEFEERIKNNAIEKYNNPEFITSEDYAEFSGDVAEVAAQLGIAY